MTSGSSGNYDEYEFFQAGHLYLRHPPSPGVPCPRPSVMVPAPGHHPTNVNVISPVLNVTNVVLLVMGVCLMACSSYQAVHNIVRSANINIKPTFSREYYLVNTRYQLELQTIHRF